MLWITPAGLGRESIGDGCCHPVVNLHFRLRGTTATVTWVQVRDPRAFTTRQPAPHVGQKATLRVRSGVLYEPLTRTTYCAHGVEKCGA